MDIARVLNSVIYIAFFCAEEEKDLDITGTRYILAALVNKVFLIIPAITNMNSLMCTIILILNTYLNILICLDLSTALELLRELGIV